MKKVSVCMLAHNTEKFFEMAIESVISQKTDFEVELVIAEDKSTDNTKEIAESYRAKYPGTIKLIVNERNLGLSGNYIEALRNCSSEYVAILDSDDYWTDPYKLQKQVDFLDKNKEYGLVYSDCNVINSEGNEIDWSEMKYLREQFSSGNLFFKLLKETAFIPTLTTCFRKELIAEDLETEEIWFFEDWWLWMRIASKAKFYFLKEKTGSYRQHPQNITKTRIENREKKQAYLRKTYSIFYSNIVYFDRHNRRKLLRSEKKIVFRRILMLLSRKYLHFQKKCNLIPLLFKYFSGFDFLARSVSKKIWNGGLPF